LKTSPYTIDDLTDRLGVFDADLIKDIVEKMIADELVKVDDSGVISILE